MNKNDKKVLEESCNNIIEIVNSNDEKLEPDDLSFLVEVAKTIENCVKNFQQTEDDKNQKKLQKETIYKFKNRLKEYSSWEIREKFVFESNSDYTDLCIYKNRCCLKKCCTTTIYRLIGYPEILICQRCKNYINDDEYQINKIYNQYT